MRRFHPMTAILILALASAGCSLVIDSSKYVGNGDGDAGPRPDGDVQPDGEVPPDGGVDGDVPNLPPVLSSVALSTYMPTLGESIRATPGPVADPEGDSTVIRYQWFRNDTAIDGATSALLATSTLAAADAVRLEAWAYDGELEGPRVHAGPVIVDADTTRWRPVMPHDFARFSPVVYDEPNRRYVRLGRELLWEYFVGDDGALRVLPIRIGGTAPPTDEFIAFHDPEGQRAFAMTLDSSALYVVDLSRRGGETWASIPVDGIPPATRIGAASWYDSANRKIWIYGGFNERETERVSDQLWTLDVRPGEERWQQITLGGTAVAPALFGSAMTEDPTMPGTMILAGGIDFTAVVPVTMYRITPGAGDTASLDELVATLPVGSFGMGSATDYVNDRIVFAGGGEDIDSGAFGVAIFDPATNDFVRPAAPMISEGILGLVNADPDDPARFLLFRGLVNTGGDTGFDLRAIDATTGEASIVVHEERPPGLSEGAMSPRRSSSATLIGGRLDDGTANPIVYSMNLSSYTWSTVTTMGDAVDGSSPVARYGTMVFDSSPWTGLQYFGGWVDQDVFADTEVWELIDARWLHRTLRMGAAPPARRGAAYVASGACGADQNYMFGGEGASGTLLGDAHSLVCDLGDRTRECYWEVQATGGLAPSPRVWATLGVDHASTAWVVGGWTGSASASLGELYTFNVCSGGAAAWTRVSTSSSTTPAARHGHSMVLDEPESGGLTSYLVFGGSTDGGSALADVWRLEIVSTTSARWVEIVPEGSLRPPPRAFHQAIWDDGGSRMIVFGGRDPYETHGDVWELVIRP